MKKYLLLLISFISIFNLIIIYYCAEASEATLSDASFALQEDVIDNHFCNVKKLDKENKSYAIKCFDVSDKGNVAVGMSDGLINVYDINDNFICGYEIYSNGIYALKWENDNLYIFFLRYNTAILLSMQGNILNTYTIKDNENYNYNDMIDKTMQRKRIEKNGFVYKLQYDFPINIDGANKLVKYDNSSQSTIVNTSYLMKTKVITTICIFQILLILVILIIIILNKVKYRNSLFKHQIN